MKKLCIILSALVMLFAAGCSKQAQQEPEVSAPEKTKRIVVSCIGDSITYGACVSSEKEKYPYMLQKELGKTYEVLHHGISAEQC